MSIAKIM